MKNGEWEIKTLQEQEVREIFTWNYPGEYSVYNLPSWETAKKENYGILQSYKRENEFFSLYFQQKFTGYFHLYQPDRDRVRLGIGLAPEYCGLGYGKICYRKVAEFVKMNYGFRFLEVEIRAFNRRAVRCCEKVGFIHEGTVKKNVGAKEVIYYKMALSLQEEQPEGTEP